MAAGFINYRLFRDGDLPALLRLWETETGWGTLTPENWRKWYVDTPFGAAQIAVAEDTRTGEVVGQFVFMPSLVCIGGQEEVSALRPFAPIVSKALSGTLSITNPLHHPVVAMYRYAIRSLREQGDIN
jgi:hypothetical protein